MSRTESNKHVSSILPEYGLQVHELHSCQSLYKQSAAYQAITDRGTFLVKPFKGLRARLDLVSSRVEWLFKHGYPHLPKWLVSKSGKPWVSYHGRLYYVSEWIEGSPLGDSLQDYRDLGEVLAKLHKLRYRSTVGRSSSSNDFLHRSKIQHTAFKQALPRVQGKSGEPGKWFREKGGRCLGLADEAWKIFQKSGVRRVMSSENPALIHGDVTRPNVIRSGSALYLVDWEFSRKGSTYYEIAKTLSNITNFSVANIQAFLEGYERHRRLKGDERLIVCAFFRLPREAWSAASMIRSGKTPHVFEILKNTWENRIAAIEWLDAWARKGR